MKLRKFRIRNYRSILDSGNCYPAERVTILAGMNEAGKSSVLQALEDFNIQNPIRDAALPIQGNGKPEIEIEFQLALEDFEGIFSGLGIPAVSGDEMRILLRKSYPAIYEFGEETIRLLGLDQAPEDRMSELQGLHDRLIPVSTRAGYQLQPFSSSDLAGTIARTKKLKRIYSQNAGNLSESDRNELDSALDGLIAGLESLPGNGSKIDHFIQKFTASMPNFILFSSFEQILPNQIPMSELSSNGWVNDLCKMSDLKIETITGPNLTAKKRHKHQLNLAINEDFERFWTQDAAKLSIDWDSNHLHFWIDENGEFFPPEVRSQGKRWHLAFYIRVTARAREGVRNIILIDEPGLYLHARAQRDILNLLEQASLTQQVIFSTHSPYLIEVDKLERIRLLLKKETRGTFIENKVHAVADRETLTPILTAIGLDLNQGIVAADRVNNVLVEGPSDYFYLTAFSLLLADDRVKFISGGGAGNMPTVGTILHGWGAKVLYLYDNDQAYKSAQRSVKKSWTAVMAKWLATLNVNGAIEDVFERSDFATHVLEIPHGDIPGKNSDYMGGRDKVLPARTFLERVRSANPPKLSDATVERVTALFADLQGRFERYYEAD